MESLKVRGNLKFLSILTFYSYPPTLSIFSEHSHIVAQDLDPVYQGLEQFVSQPFKGTYIVESITIIKPLSAIMGQKVTFLFLNSFSSSFFSFLCMFFFWVAIHGTYKLYYLSCIV